MLFRGNMAVLFRPGLRKDFRDEFDAYAEEYTQYLRSDTTELPEISGSMITGFSRLVERGDGMPLTYLDPVIGPKTLAFVKEFAAGFIITRQMVEDDQYNKANQHAKWLANAVRLTNEYSGAQLLDDAFTGTYFTGWDGLPLIANNHKLINSPNTYSNLGSPVQVSVTGLTNLVDLAKLAVDQNGDPVIVRPTKLIIGNHAGDENRALQIWNSMYEPFTAENQENALKLRMKDRNGTMPNTFMTSHYKTSRRSYFIVDDRYNDAHFTVKTPVEFEDTQDFDTSALKYMARERFAVYFFDPFGWYGCNPS